MVKLLEKAFGSEWWKQKDSLGNSIFPETCISRNWAADRSINKLRPMIRDGFDRLYIPGSSIKGAIRTAIAYNLLSKDQTKISTIESTLARKLGSIDKKKIANDLFMANLFSNFALIYQGQEVLGETSPQNTDVMRVVKISDSSPMILNGDYNQSIISEVVISSYFTQDEVNLAKVKNSPSNYVEMVHNVKAEFIFTLDKNDTEGMLSWFQHKDNIQFPQSIGAIIDICKKFAQAQWKHERDYWNSIGNSQNRNLDNIREFYSNETCPYDLRLGWATGMMGTTVDLLFSTGLRKNIRNTCCARPAGDYVAPKSRRIAIDEDGKIKYPLGWIKLEVL
ncbi:MAG: type III-A CRISPR-associated RAMP protein Csm5 [Coleofasciculaceae cyanobacterium SM2_1_6]|nr:type III-A CRISPR-associated RAMP protein Csm5 [Coleofasciculaceae cyanobacterium SM2_1_6]